jgi:hypothetical protein
MSFLRQLLEMYYITARQTQLVIYRFCSLLQSGIDAEGAALVNDESISCPVCDIVEGLEDPGDPSGGTQITFRGSGCVNCKTYFEMQDEFPGSFAVNASDLVAPACFLEQLAVVLLLVFRVR